MVGNEVQEQDQHYMELALREARKGQGRTSPNPCVGAVVVRDNTIVGRGYHRCAGAAHAEVMALGDAGLQAEGATLYVTLEPCNHTGRTPPCTRAILAAGIRRVVIGMADPNPHVTGGGADYLRSQGIEVESGVLEAKCCAINLPFIKHTTTGQPWVIMKAGMSLDGRISWEHGAGGQITGKGSSRLVHRLRDQVDGILVGVNTALIDNPSLTTRIEGEEGHDPLRIILDTNLRLSPESHVLTQQSPAETWIFCAAEADPEQRQRLEDAGGRIHVVATDSRGLLDLETVLTILGEAGVTSLLVEGGAAVHGSFLAHRLVDEAYLFMAPFFIGDSGTPLITAYSAAAARDIVALESVRVRVLDNDILIRGLVQKM